MAIRSQSVARLAREIADDALVLDVGGWITPYTRADWVIDLMPYETRGRLGRQGTGEERFSADTWVQRDICDHAPSPFEEHTYGFQGPWVGWGHHRWLVEVGEGRLDFVFKHHVIHGPERNHFPTSYYATLSEDDKAQTFWWEGSFDYGERIMMSAEELDPYLSDYVAAHRAGNPTRDRVSAFLRRVANRVR